LEVFFVLSETSTLEENSLLSLPVLILTLADVSLYTNTSGLAVVLLTGGGGGAGAVDLEGACLILVLALNFSTSGFICACATLKVNIINAGRNIPFFILI